MESVVVIADGSPWTEEAVQWAAAHAKLVDAEVETHRLEDDFHAQLVVVGYQARTGSPLGLGSHVLSVVCASGCDAVVVRGTPDARHGMHGRVTALVSGGPDDAGVLARAVVFAQNRGAALRVLHAAPLSVVREDLDEDHGWVLQRSAELLAGFPHTAVLVRKQPHEAISRCTDTDLIVVGPGETRSCGAVTRAALHHAPCPVLVAHRSVQEEHRGVPSLPAPRRPVRATV
ncbi:universal stress protein [Lentzea flaviverrucosa]|uniref:Universal stress protein family protein n=1 Tax=Lentzea flaviverrucosa TaxID=200379 RepID=A0A1H9XWI1_9PSEU|nr:universal stress protein [Lentzea flaviverrucosa]RDI34328.1 universal stress protein family protein [Lentzea flaviverrucosa]SES50501.1 Universal stress protein family protein [Lentzea flaviverrucosa]